MEAHQAMAVRVEQQRWVRSSRRRPSEKAEVIFRMIDTLARTLFYSCILLFRTFDLLSRTQSSRGPVLPFPFGCFSKANIASKTQASPSVLTLTLTLMHKYLSAEYSSSRLHSCLHVHSSRPNSFFLILRKVLFACL